MGFLFEGDQSTAWRDIRRLKPFVKECVPIPDKIGKIGRIDELLKLFLDLGTFADAAIEEIPMPKDKQKRKDFYSGKKKRHTVKPHTADSKNGMIVHINKGVEGKKHVCTCSPIDIDNYFDLGYMGVGKDFPELKVKIPHKKPKGEELSGAHKEYNKKIKK